MTPSEIEAIKRRAEAANPLLHAAVHGMLEGLRDNPSAHTAASISGIASAALTALSAAEAKVDDLQRQVMGLSHDNTGHLNVIEEQRTKVRELEAALRDLFAAYDGGYLEMNSPEIGEPESGIPYHSWHDEWLHYARAALAADTDAGEGK